MHQPKGHTARTARLGQRIPQLTAAGRSPSARRRAELFETIGELFDRDPCPHALRTRELVAPPQFGPQADRVPFLVPGQSVVKTTEGRCVRPGSHVRENRMISVPDPTHPGDPHYVTAETVPDDDARLHADAAGRTWK